jgi:hypothetical protein
MRAAQGGECTGLVSGAAGGGLPMTTGCGGAPVPESSTVQANTGLSKIVHHSSPVESYMRLNSSEPGTAATTAI